MKVVLLGYMGVGKSTLGKLLADILNVKFLDLDSFIEEKEGLSITNLFEKKGEIYFRKQETAALNELLSSSEGMVLSLGGGTPVYSNNMKTITEADNVTSVYLKLQIDALVAKLFQQCEDRPVISHINDKDKFEDFVKREIATESKQSANSESIKERWMRELKNKGL